MDMAFRHAQVDAYGGEEVLESAEEVGYREPIVPNHLRRGDLRLYRVYSVWMCLGSADVQLKEVPRSRFRTPRAKLSRSQLLRPAKSLLYRSLLHDMAAF